MTGIVRPRRSPQKSAAAETVVVSITVEEKPAGHPLWRVRGEVLHRGEAQQAGLHRIEVTHPLARDVFRFHIARVFINDELKMPIRYESYDWPTEPGGEPELIEEYSYLDLKLNNGFTDKDFSPSNPDYQFPQATKKPKQAEEGK